MGFASYGFLYFLALVVALYWLVRHRVAQNVLLVAASYLFYGFVHPWFCILLAVSTALDYLCGLGIGRWPRWRKGLLGLSVAGNLGLLAAFKYFGFFAANVHVAFAALGVHFSPLTLRVVLPIGVSFYTFQTLAYTIDVYRGNLQPRKNLLDFAVFVAAFPKLIAGPIERGAHFLPQIERPRRWSWDHFYEAWPLLVRGFVKKMVVADQVARYVNKIYMLDHPSAWLLAAGSLAFTVQIYADFSGYTDIARGVGRLLGFDLTRNFRAPYLAVSPSDFWRRWHISFSTWIRDYLYIPLGGSRVGGPVRGALVLLATMGLAGLWHGAAWHYVAWGVYHALLLMAYRQLGLAGRWRPRRWLGTAAACATMFAFTVVGWALFRAPSLGWLAEAVAHMAHGLSGDSLLVGAVAIAYVLACCVPMIVLHLAARVYRSVPALHGAVHGLAIVCIVVFTPDTGQEFVYAQF